MTSGHYEQRDPHKSVEQFRMVREANLALLKSLTAEQRKHHGMHSERGQETIEQDDPNKRTTIVQTLQDVNVSAGGGRIEAASYSMLATNCSRVFWRERIGPASWSLSRSLARGSRIPTRAHGHLEFAIEAINCLRGYSQCLQK